MSELGLVTLWGPPALVVGVVLAAGVGARIALSRLSRDRRHAALAASVGLALFAFIAAHDALPPTLFGAAPRWVFAAALALVALVLPWRRRAGHPPERLRPAPVVLGLGLGLLPLFAWMGIEGALAFAEPEEAGELQATWRHRMAPGDPRAWLALAHQTLRAGDAERAQALAAVAAEMAPGGKLEAATLELRAEVLAAASECEEARELFEQALELRAREAMETLELNLEDSYRMPRSFAANCGWAPAASAQDGDADAEGGQE